MERRNIWEQAYSGKLTDEQYRSDTMSPDVNIAPPNLVNNFNKTPTYLNASVCTGGKFETIVVHSALS